MMSPEDVRKLLEKLSPDKSDRETHSFHLSKEVVERFKKNCGKVAPARVLEEVLDHFSDAVEGISTTSNKDGKSKGEKEEESVIP